MPPRKKYNSAAKKNKNRIKNKRPTARNQRKQINSNQNQIIAIKKHLNLTKKRIRWHCGFTGTFMNQYPLIIPLTSGPSSTSPATMNSVPPVSMQWRTTMTTAPEDSQILRSKVVVNSQWIDLQVYGGTEPSLLSLTAFIVQLRESNAQQVYDETSAMTTLARNTDFVTPLAGAIDSGYGAYLNTDRFKIIKRIEFNTIGPNIGWPGGPPGTGDVGQGTRNFACRRQQFKLNYGSTVLKSTGSGATSSTLEYSQIDPKHKRFIIIFSDNSLVDNEYPSVVMSSLLTGYSAD